MIATESSGLVPAVFLACASCLLPARISLVADNPREPVGSRDCSGATLGLPLSPTEKRVLPLVLAGLADKEIASVLGRSLPTVKHHVSAILLKHQATSRARLMAVLREAAEGNPESALLRRFGT